MGDDPRPSHPYRSPMAMVIEQQRIDRYGTPRDALEHIRELRATIDLGILAAADRETLANLISLLTAERNEVRAKASPIGEHANWISGALGGGSVVVALSRLAHGWVWVALFLAAAAFSRYGYSQAQRWLDVVAEINAAIADVRALLPKAPFGAYSAEDFAAVVEGLRERQEMEREATKVRVDGDAPPSEVEPKPPPSVSEKKGNKP